MKNDVGGSYQVKVTASTLEVLSNILRLHGQFPKTPEMTIQMTCSYLANCHMKLERQWHDLCLEKMKIATENHDLKRKIKILEGLNNGK